ncbi:hypothetical protein KM043_002580 [Ampulex compressa]|nr:hypothetical protein KM043_002580 [Ampulex compressa]
MLFRFCNLCQKTLDTPLLNLRRCYKKAASNARQKRKVLETRSVLEEEYGPPIIACKRRSFNFYKGQVYSKHEKIPIASQAWKHPKSVGDHFFVYPDVKEDESKHNETAEYQSFRDFDIDPRIPKILEEHNITAPVTIQQLGIPEICSGYHSLLAAETGCGKTLTYAIPMINQILQWKNAVERDYNSPLGLIVTPSRELAVQIGNEIQKLAKPVGIITKTMIGGRTKKMLLNPPVVLIDILVASFGVISKMTTNRIYTLKFVRHVVLDEADALFHKTFEEKVQVFMKRIPLSNEHEVDANGFPTTAQLTLASATMPSRAANILGNIINLDYLKTISTDNLHRIPVLQKFMRVSGMQKPAELLKYIKPKVLAREPTIIFSNNNNTADWITLFLNENGIKVINLNGNMPLKIRQGKYAEFLNAKYMILSTTNAGSRGLDTVAVKHILNYEFPLETADYIHRCGRTGRLGSTKNCRVTNFISKPLEIDVVQKIERAIRRLRPIPIINLSKNRFEEDESFVPLPEKTHDELPIEDEEDTSIPF